MPTKSPPSTDYMNLKELKELKELGDASRKAMDAYCACECHVCKDPNRKRGGDSGCIRQRAYYDASAEVVRAQKNHDPSTEWS